MTDVIESEHLGHTIISSKKVSSYKDKTKSREFKQWLAKVTGPCTTYGFKREFVKSKQSDHSKDFWRVEFILENGFLYEYKNLYAGQGEYVSGFFAINEKGELLSLSLHQARKLMNMPVKDWTKPEKKEKVEIDESKFQKDDIPF